MLRRSAVLLALALGLAPALPAAEGTDTAYLSPGSRVRIHRAAHARPLTGTLVALPPAQVVVKPDSGTPSSLSIAHRDITRVEVGVPGRSRAGKGAILGLLPGLLLFVGAALDEPDESGILSINALVTVGAGAALGALIGHSSRPTTWEDAALPR